LEVAQLSVADTAAGALAAALQAQLQFAQRLLFVAEVRVPAGEVEARATAAHDVLSARLVDGARRGQLAALDRLDERVTRLSPAGGQGGLGRP
jgi:hypothetical protein